MPSRNPAERSLIAAIAANESWAETPDRSARTAKARAASPGGLDYWERQVDPSGTLSPAVRAQRAESKRWAHFQRLALKSAQARRTRKEGP